MLFDSSNGVITMAIWWVSIFTNSWWLSSSYCRKVANDSLVYESVVNGIDLGMVGYMGLIYVFPAFCSRLAEGPSSDPKGGKLANNSVCIQWILKCCCNPSNSWLSQSLCRYWWLETRWQAMHGYCAHCHYTYITQSLGSYCLLSC